MSSLRNVDVSFSDDEREIAENASPAAEESGSSCVSLQQFVEDDNKVSPENRMTYILMLCYQNVEDFNLLSTHPYSAFHEKAGYKRKFKFSKKLICQELKRRNPSAKPNGSNSTVAALMEKLTPLDDAKDKEYVLQKDGEYRAMLGDALREEEEDAGTGTGANARMTYIDRLRFACLIDIDEFYEAYLLSQNCLTRAELDAGASGAGTEFWDIAIPKLNDAGWVPITQIARSLHSDFAQGIECPKGAYEWTIEKGKKYLNDVRRNLTEMIRRYELSGNGANQAAHDGSDNEREESDENWGRFDPERASRVAAMRNDSPYDNDDGSTSDTINGDDRSRFLRHLPTDWLYTWNIFDQRDIIRFTCAQLSVSLSASSHETPSPISRTRGSRSGRGNNNERLFQNQRDMVSTVRGIGASIADMSRANTELGRAAKIRRIDELRSQRYRVALAKAAASSASEEEVHETYIQELSEQIQSAEKEIESDSSPAATNSEANGSASA